MKKPKDIDLAQPTIIENRDPTNGDLVHDKTRIVVGTAWCNRKEKKLWAATQIKNNSVTWYRVDDIANLSIENYMKLKKQEWGEGEWNDEPDEYKMSYKRYKTRFNRNILGVWCGYIGLSKKEFNLVNDTNLSLHGGITYSEYSDDIKYCHKDDPKCLEKTCDVVIGFDCGHFGDLTPATHKGYIEYCKRDRVNSDFYTKSTYKTLNFCKKEIRRFIRELIKTKEAREI